MATNNHDILRVLFFASLRDVMGCAEVHLMSAGTMSTVMKQLEQRFGADKIRHLENSDVLLAYNQKIMHGNFHLSLGNELAFLPPVTGG